mgnify:CR=1 FL=1
MTRNWIIRMVALKMDEISSSDEVYTAVDISDNNPLYTQINCLLDESINEVLLKAPIYRIQDHVSKAATSVTVLDIFGGARKKALITMPDDFVRFVSITDDCFHRPITDLAIEGDEVDKKQHNKHIVAKKAKPVAVVSNTENGRMVHCYSYDTSDTPNPTMLYVKRYESGDMLSEINLDQYIINIATWVCAGKVFSIQGDFAKSKACDENATALMA